MFKTAARLPENAPGPWHVNTDCIDCDLCRETAPKVFRREETIGLSIVYHQPANDVELREAEEAKAGCPADAISAL